MTVTDTPLGIFATEFDGRTLILTPICDLHETHYPQIEESAALVLEFMEQRPVHDMIVDLTGTDWFGSTALSFLVRVWNKLRARKGCLILCHVTEHESEILRVTRLQNAWPVCATVEEARQLIEKQPSEKGSDPLPLKGYGSLESG
jgi:anti-sigma B factor antagonist